MQKITVRSYTKDEQHAYNMTAQYMAKGKSEIYDTISKNLGTFKDVRDIFELLFSEIIDDTYVIKFWEKYNSLTEAKKEKLITVIVDWYCEMGNIMGYCGTVLEALKEV